MNLSSTIKSIQDIMRKDDGVDGDAQRIGQLTWMLFLKIFDQCEETWEDDADDKDRTYTSPLPEECRWRNWAKFIEDEDGKKQPRMAPSDIIDHVDKTLFPALKELQVTTTPGRKKAEKEEHKRLIARTKVVRSVFENSNNYMKSGTLVQGVIEKLDEAIDFHDMKKRGQMGDIYEHILNDLRSAGNSGEFYTPRAVTDFMVQMVNPRLDKREVVLDPACGTGGFLTASIQHFEDQLTKKSGPEDRRAIADCIRGFEKKQLPHLLCTTNMLLHNIEVPSMIHKMNTLGKGWNDWKKPDRVECIISNPPFGGIEEDGVGGDYPSDIKTRETADMFLVLIIKKLLKENGGRGAVVLPDGTLFGDGVKAKVKELLLEECNLHTIIRLPNGVFNPYTGIKTNLLFFTKGKPTEDIWFYEHQYPEGVKSYSKTKPLDIKELQPIAEWWGNEEDGFKDRVENQQAWKFDFKQAKKEAEEKAAPHRKEAEKLSNEAHRLKSELKELKGSSKAIKGIAEKKKQIKQVEALTNKIELSSQKAKDEENAADAIYWPIYNLDKDNPHIEEKEELDPSKLLLKYNEQQGSIQGLRDQLKAILSQSLTSTK